MDKADLDRFVETIDGCTWYLREAKLTADQWEIIRTSWIELGINLAAAKPSDVDEAESYPNLDEVRIDNFNDAMKVLK